MEEATVLDKAALIFFMLTISGDESLFSGGFGCGMWHTLAHKLNLSYDKRY